MATYYVREDGSASFSDALGPVTDAALCMSPATFNAGFVSTAVDGDEFVISGRGGTIDTGLIINKGGDNAAITVRGEVGNAPTIDVSGNTSTAEACIFSEGANIANLVIDGPMTLEGNGGRAAFRRVENGTGSRSVKIAPTQGITVAGNDTANSGATVHDGFSWAGNCLDVCGTLTANDCDQAVPAGGAFQGFTPHDTCDIVVDNAGGSGNSIHVGEANGSKIVIKRATFGASNFFPFVVSTDGGHIEILSGSYTNNTHAGLCDVRTTDGSGYLKLANMDISIGGNNGTAEETNFGGRVIFENVNLTVDTDRFRIQLDPNASWVWDYGIVTLTTVDGASFVDMTPTTTGSPTSALWKNLVFTPPATATATRIVNATNDDGGRFIAENCVFDGSIATGEVVLIGSSSQMGVDLVSCTFHEVDATECIDINLTGAGPLASQISVIDRCVFHNCADALALSDADYVLVKDCEFTGSTPSESNTVGSLWGRTDEGLREFS